MAGQIPTAGFIELSGSVSGGQFSWTSARAQSFEDVVVDVDNDGGLNAGLDFFFHPAILFTGYTVPVLGEDHPVFQHTWLPGVYYVPYLETQAVRLPGAFPASGQSGDYRATGAKLPSCFLPGTWIATTEGPMTVETLRPGMVLLAADGRRLPLRWLWRQTIFSRLVPHETGAVIRVRAGALGAGLPQGDLWVTADHALLIDGILCHAGALVDGAGIVSLPAVTQGDSFVVYHLETAAHEVILANGVAAETFSDVADRSGFDNCAGFRAVWGQVPRMAALPFPRAISRRQVPARLRDRVMQAGRAAGHVAVA